MLSFQFGVTVWFPIPLLAAELNILVAVGAVVPAGSVYGYVIVLLASVHVAPLSQATVGAPLSVVADVDRVLVPAVNVVEVDVTFQPVPDPVASLTSRA